MRLIVHGAQDSGPDRLGTAVARELGEVLKMRFAIERMPGDHGAEAARYLAEHDGSDDVLATFTPTYIQAFLQGHSPVHISSLTPVARLVSDDYFIVVGSSSGYGEVADLIKAGRERPLTTLAWRGSINHIIAHLLRASTGIEYSLEDVEHSPSIVDRADDPAVDWTVATLVELGCRASEPGVRLLASTGSRRHPSQPRVPTLTELGIDVQFTLWRGLVAPGGISIGWKSALWEAVAAMARSPSWQRYVLDSGQCPSLLVKEAFASFLQEQENLYQNWFSEFGLLQAGVQR